METQVTKTAHSRSDANVRKPTMKQLHGTSWRGLFFILKEKGTLLKWPFFASILVSIAVIVYVLLVAPGRTFDILNKSSDLLITVFPGLLGFSLGGYAIVVGFSNTELIKESSMKDTVSVYQLLNSIFTLSLLIQVFTTIFSFAVNWIIKTAIFNLGGTGQAIIIAQATNIICLLFLVFGAIYSLLLTPYIIINLFTLSQINNLHFTIKKIEEES